MFIAPAWSESSAALCLTATSDLDIAHCSSPAQLCSEEWHRPHPAPGRADGLDKMEVVSPMPSSNTGTVLNITIHLSILANDMCPIFLDVLQIKPLLAT